MLYLTTEQRFTLQKRQGRTMSATRSSRWILFVWLAMVGSLLGGLPAVAQLTTGSILGTVKDPSGAVIPNATVTVRNLDTHISTNVITNAAGEFSANALVPGHYSVVVKSAGFKVSTFPEVNLSAGDRARVDAQLELGAGTQTVNVEAFVSPALETDSSTLSTNVPERMVQDLPLNGRNFVQLAQLAAGANEGPPQSISGGTRPDDRRQTSSVSVNGQSDSINNEMIDGMDNNERIIGTIGVRPSIDAIQEFRVQTNMYTAEAGRTAGGIINIVTKSGTNTLHGSAYEFLRNNIFDGRDFFARHGKAPEYRQNQYGGSLGGPLQRDKTFGFGDYEGLRIVQGTTLTSTVPTLFQEQHPGNFSDIGGPVLQPSQLSPIALKYFALYPAPNLPGTANNFTISPKLTQNSDTFDVRADHYFANKDSAFARYTFNNVTSFTPGSLPEVNGVQPNGNLNQFSGTAKQRAQNYQANYSHIFTPNALLTLRAGYTRINNGFQPLNYGNNLSQTFGVVNANLGSARTSGLTPMAPSGYAQLGDSTFVPLQYLDNTFQYNGDFTYAKGTHNFKMGAVLIRRQALEAQNPYGIGFYTFVAAPTGNSLASFLAGDALTVQRTNIIDVPGYRLWEPSAYFQDDWRVKQWLTLNMGLRYDIFTPPTEAHNRLSNFNPATATLMVPGQNGVGPTAGIKTDYKDIAPRFGFSASLRPTTVLRGGFGLSYWPDNIGFPFGLENAPYVFTYAPNNNTVGLSTPLPLPVPSSVNNLSGALSGIGTGYTSSYIEQFNINVQQQMGANVLTVGYVGELGRHLNVNSNINLALPSPLPFATRRPFYSALPNVTAIGIRDSRGYSNYNALQASLERRYTNGLALSANYTWEHGINDVISYSLNQFGEGYNAVPTQTSTLERGTSDLNVTNRIVGEANYAIPGSKSENRWERTLLNGWQANTIIVWETGLPFTIVNSSPRTNTGVGANGDRPNQVGNPHLANAGINEWFNVAAFAPQSLGTIGNVRRDSLYGPHFRHVDLSLFRNFSLRQLGILQLRVETFNMTNTPNFATPVQQLGTPSFGSISNTRIGSTPREIQFAVKLEF